MELPELEATLDEFAAVRGWQQHHLPRSLMLALTKEVGELTELLQWTPDSDVDRWLSHDENAQNMADEIADVFIYLHYLARSTKIDLTQAVRHKLEMNAAKYPPTKESSPCPE